MTLNLTITNADACVLSAVKNIVKLAPQAKLHVKKSRASAWKSECDELVSAYKVGRIKGYKNAKEMHEALLNGEV